MVGNKVKEKETNRANGIVIGLFVLLCIISIFISLFSGDYNFGQVKEGRTAFHIGLFLLLWGILIPLSFKFLNYSFIFKWIRNLEKTLQFGITKKAYVSFNSILMISFGIVFMLIGLGLIPS